MVLCVRYRRDRLPGGLPDLRALKTRKLLQPGEFDPELDVDLLFKFDDDGVDIIQRFV